MNTDLICKLVHQGRIQWQGHAFERMMERNISRDDVKNILIEGELIEDYSDDYPLPSGLYHGFNNQIPLHVVVALDLETEWCYIITAYRPDSEHFEQDFKTRKK